MKKILLGIAILAVSVGVANATVAYNDFKYTLSKTSGAGTFSGNASSGYTLDFGNIIQNSNSGLYMANLSLKNTGSSAFDVDFGTLTGGGFGLSLGAKGDNFTLVKNAIDNWAVTFSSTALGHLSGNIAIALSGGNCDKTIQLNLVGNVISPVPEAEEWAMMMLGLGMMGFVAKRKQALAA